MHDAIIIGGGPAGATAATELARAGKSALVLEREHFPRFHIGESLLPYNRELFEEIGVWDQIASAGFMVKRAAQFSTGHGEPRARLVFGNGIFTEHPEAFQVERSRFDEILLRHASTSGAEVREGATVLGHQINDDGVTVRYRTDDGADLEAHARFLLDASGLTALTGTREGIKRVQKDHRKVAVFGHYSGVVMPDCDEEGDIILVVRANSWCWMIPLSKDKVSVGIVLDRAEFADSAKPAALFDQIVRETPELWRRMSVARAESPVHVINDYSFRMDRMVSPRLVRIGDAAGFMDPIFSSGVMLAMQTGRDGAHCVIDALARGEALTEKMRGYEKDTRVAMRRFWDFIERYYTRHFIDLFLQPSPFLQMTSAINAVLAGRPDMPWRIRWRLFVFFGFVWLQKHVPIVRRVRWRDAEKVVPQTV